MDMKPYSEQEYNRLCVEFIGLKCHEPSGYWTLPTFMDGDGWTMTDMKFHSDWNWIMQVVEKIESLLHRPNELDTPIYCVTNFRNIVKIETVNDEIVWVKRSSKKEAFIQAIWEFLQWYNEQKQ